MLFFFSSFFQFYDVATNGDSRQEELAKFGYRLERKVSKIKKLAIFW